MDTGYVAGLIDGEGTVTITRQNKYKKNTFQYRTWVYINNTYEPLVRLLEHELGGSADWDYKHKKNKAKGWSPIHRWRVMSHSDVKQILEVVLPHLIVKRRQAELVLRFIASRQSRPKNAAYSKKEIALYGQVRTLNGN